jgi:imidazolonepropionase-like amidohydrolase
VVAGKAADLVVLDADPLTDIHNTTRIRAVLLGGKLFDRTALDALLARAEAAAKGAKKP